MSGLSEIDLAWAALLDELHAELDQGHLRSFGIVLHHRPLIEAALLASASSEEGFWERAYWQLMPFIVDVCEHWRIPVPSLPHDDLARALERDGKFDDDLG